MSKRYPGGFLTGDEPTVNQTEADGIWTLDQQAGYQGQNQWPFGQNIVQRSLRFNSADSAYQSWTPAQAGNRKTWTWSGWVKRSALGSLQRIFGNFSAAGTNGSDIEFNSSDQIRLLDYTSSTQYQLITTAVYRDVSAWYHIVVALDTTQATSSDRLKLYVNGVQVTAFGTATYPTLNFDGQLNTATAHGIGRAGAYATEYYNGYLADINFVDGQALTPSDFGQTNATTGVWTPIRYEGSYGVNGFYLFFNNNSSVPNLGLSAIPYTSDQGWNRTSLLLNTNGVDADDNNTFLDSSSNNFTITRNGNTTQGRFSPFSDGWSNYFDGTGDYLTVPDNAALDFGAGDFCIEGWFYLTTAPVSGVTNRRLVTNYQDSSNGYQVSIGLSGGNNVFLLAFSGDGVDKTGTTALNLNAWNHFAICGASGDIALFVNGTKDGSNFTGATALDSTAVVQIGALHLSGTTYDPFAGYIANIRLVKGATVYDPSASTITVPTSPLTAISGTSLLTCQSNRFVDNSTNNFAITRNGDVKVTAFSPFTPTQGYSAAVNGGSGYFDGTGDYLSLNNTGCYPSGTQDTTVELWWYPTSVPAVPMFLNNETTGAFGLYYESGSLQVDSRNSSNILSAACTFTTHQWYHIAYSRSGNTHNLYLNGTRIGTTSNAVSFSTPSNPQNFMGQPTSNRYLPGYVSNVRVVLGTALYTASTITVPTSPLTAISGTELLLNFTNAGIVDATGSNDLETVGNAQVDTAVTKWGSSVKFDGTGDYIDIPFSQDFVFGTGDFTVELWVYVNSTGRFPMVMLGKGSDASPLAESTWALRTNATSLIFSRYDDPTSTDFSVTWAAAATTWYHIAVTRSGTDLRFFVDGTQVGATQTSSTNFSAVSTTDPLRIGRFQYGGGTLDQLNGYIEDLRVTKGLARYTGNFTVPDAPFAYDKSDINYKQWVPNNFSVSAGAGNDSLVDTPTPYGVDTGAGGEVRGNYATLNPIYQGKPATVSITEGNLTTSMTSNVAFGVPGTITFPATGKWYAEVVMTAISGQYAWVGITDLSIRTTMAQLPGYYSGDYAYANGGLKLNNNSSSAYGASWTTEDVIGIAVDCDAGTIAFYKNGSSQGTAYSGLTSLSTKTFCFGAGSLSITLVCNFGQRPFAYTAPSGFKALCTTNLPTPTIADGSEYFNTIIYTGNNSSAGATRNLTGVGFQPDFVWLKNRGNPYSHQLFDAIRGTGNKNLRSDSTSGEGVDGNLYGYLSSFDSDGFQVTNGSHASVAGIWVNQSSQPFVAWNWNAGGSNATNTDGTITSTVRANPTAGFSIVSYTGTGVSATVGHGLGVAPNLIILKRRNATSSSLGWIVFSYLNGVLNYGRLDDTNALLSAGEDDPTSSVFSVLTNADINTNTGTYIAYCFAEVEGYSKFGSYTGNGSTDGPFVYCGFRPAFVLVKRTTAGASWLIYDTARNEYNVTENVLAPDLTSSEATIGYALDIDLLSNGIKFRNADSWANQDTVTFIFAAFAENPFKYSLAR